MLLSNFLLFGLFLTIGTAVKLTVSPSGGNKTSPLQYGLMFEDINHSGDGGIYAELIQNRAFQASPRFPASLYPWTAIGNATITLDKSKPLSAALPNSVHIAPNKLPGGKIGIRNPGWWGIDVKPQIYRGSFWVRGEYNGTFLASFESALTGQVWWTSRFKVESVVDKWTEVRYQLKPQVAAPYPNNTLSLTWDSGAALNLNLISLFPPTYKNRINGMRMDLMEHLKALNPSFLRMPGGNNLEGDSPPYLWKWNETIGPLQNRPGRAGTWLYQNTDGLGLIEYLHWCDDLGMEPILAVWGGLYLDGTIISKTALQPYVQDTLDELEFIMGDVSTPYGKLRASLGYPTPWKIKYVEVGNEDNLNSGLSSYQSYRFVMFHDAIKAKYPDMIVIASTVENRPRPANSAGDYHQYTRPDYFVSQHNFFDNFPRDHKVMIGEYAHIQPNTKTVTGVDWDAPKLLYPVWVGTVAEAIFLIGAERNTDAMIGAAYAPLLMNMNSYEWAPDLISFTADPAQDILSTSYHQIKLFSNARTTTTLPITADTPAGPAYYVAGINSASNQYILKVAVYNATAAVPFKVTFQGQAVGKTATLTVLTAPGPYSQNELGGKNQVIETTTSLKSGGAGFEFTLPNYSVAVLTSGV